jgi:hypothetical protein
MRMGSVIDQSRIEKDQNGGRSDENRETIMDADQIRMEPVAGHSEWSESWAVIYCELSLLQVMVNE